MQSLYLIVLKHLIKSSHKADFLFRKNLFSVIRAQHVLSYHEIYVPCCRRCCLRHPGSGRRNCSDLRFFIKFCFNSKKYFTIVIFFLYRFSIYFLSAAIEDTRVFSYLSIHFFENCSIYLEQVFFQSGSIMLIIMHFFF